MIPLKLTRAHSPTKDTGRVFSWLVAEGDQVKSGQAVVEIELGRVTMEIEAPSDGIIHLVAQRGATVPIGGTLAEIRTPAEMAASTGASGPAAAEEAEAEPQPEPEPEPVAEAEEPEPEAQPEPEPEPAAEAEPERAPEPEPVASEAAPPAAAQEPLATPAARRLAEELGIDLGEVQGTGPDGRILAEDVEKVAAARPATQLITSIPTEESPAAPPAQAEPEPAPERSTAPEPAAEAEPQLEPEPQPEPEPEPTAAPTPAAEAPPPAPEPPAPAPLEPQAEAPPEPPAAEPEPEPEPAAAPAPLPVASSGRTGLHIHMGGELAADGLVEAHRAASRKFEGRTTVTDLLIQVVARALTEVPELIGTVDDQGNVERSAAVHLALSDASENPEEAPVLRNAPSLKLEEIASERTRLAEAAQRKQLAAEDLAGATCTFSNLGGYPLDFYVPTGAAGQIALVTTGRVMEKPISFQRMLTIRPRMWVSVALDGRGADAETGGRFLSALQRRLNELPETV